MKKMTLFLIAAFACLIGIAQNNVGIGTNSPDPSAALDVSSTSKGMLIPRMTTVQRNAIATPATGLMVYDVTAGGFYYYNGSSWLSFSGGTASSGNPPGVCKDANGNVLGYVITNGQSSLSLKSTTGYIYSINWDGTFNNQQIYYSNADCSGTAWLNSGSSTSVKRLWQYLVYEGKTNGFYTYANPDAFGLCAVTSFTGASLWNGGPSGWSCGTGGANYGFLLTRITRTQAGIPNTITPPLTITY